MMLEMIEKLVVEDCRIWKGCHEFEFVTGVNVIHGDNRIGKSTLAMILMLTMTHPAKSNNLKIHLLPWSGGSPKSSVTFTTQEGRFTISKVWGDGDQSQLIDHESGNVIANGGEAEDQVRELAFEMPPASGNYSTNSGPMGNLAKNAAKYLPSLSFHLQGEIHIAPEMGEQLRRIGLTFDDAEMAKALLAIAIGAEAERAKFIRTLLKDGSPRGGTDGVIMTKITELESMKTQLGEARDLETQINKAEDDLFEYQSRNEQEISEENQQQTREEIENLRTAGEDHRLARDEANEAAERLRLVHEPLAQIIKDRNEHIAELERLSDKEKEHSTTASQAKLNLDSAEDALAEAAAISKDCEEQFNVAKAWNDHLTREQTLIEDNKALEEARKHLEKRTSSKFEQAKLQQKFKEIKLPMDEDWRALRKLDEQIAVARASRKMEIRVHDKTSDIRVSGDGNLIEENGEASERIEIRKGKKLLIEVNQAMSGKSPSEFEQEKSLLLKKLGAKSMADLHQWQLESNALDTSISNLGATLEALPTEEALNQKIASHEARVEKKVEKPKGSKPEGVLSEIIIRLEERKRISNGDFELKDKAKNEALVNLKTAEALHTEAVGAHMAKSSELDDHRNAHGSDDEVNQRESEAKGQSDKAQKVHATFRANKGLKEDTPLERAKLLQENLTDYDTRRANVLQLAERVKQLRNNSLLQELPTFEADIIRMEKELQDLQFDHDAYQHIARIANMEQVNAQASSRNKISEEIDRLLQHVWGETIEIQLNEEGKPVQTQGIAVEDESHGARGQLQIILRMVLLGEASNHEGTTMLLDDALTSADQGCLSRMKDVIRASVRKDSMQMIIFSCKGVDYTDIADKVYNLNDI